MRMFTTMQHTLYFSVRDKKRKVLLQLKSDMMSFDKEKKQPTNSNKTRKSVRYLKQQVKVQFGKVENPDKSDTMETSDIFLEKSKHPAFFIQTQKL